MEALLKDLRYSLRMLVKNPTFTSIAVLALALGIGANTAIFSVVNSVLLEPLPFKDPDQLVGLFHNYAKMGLKATVSVPGYIDYRDKNQYFDNVMAFSGWNANLSDQGEPERLTGRLVSYNYFETLGAAPAQGRSFTAEDDRPGNNRVVILSHGLWQRRFGSDPGIIDRTLTLNGESYTVIGVMPGDFSFGQDIDIYSPLAFSPQQLGARGSEFLNVIARLKPGATIEQAQADMDALSASIREQNPDAYPADANWGVLLTSLREQVVGDIRPALIVLLVAVAFVLLIACANVANLLLARAATRQKEMAIRTALGASRWRVVRQLLTESVMLALIGGLLGLILAVWGVDLLVTLNPENIPRAKEIGIDGRVVAFTFGVSFLTGVLFGLVPAFQASKTDLHETLKEGGRSSSSGGRGRNIRSLLVVSEVAIALLLLVGAGLLIKSFLQIQRVDPGYNPEKLLVMQLSLAGAKYRQAAPVDDFYQQAYAGIAALPGVESVGACSTLPMSGSISSGSFRIEGRPVPPGQSSPHGDRWNASPDYFKTMQIPLIKGRYFTEADRAGSTPVAIIDESLAAKYWPDEDPIGKRITFEGGAANPVYREIVGVVGYVKHRGLENIEARVQYYAPHRQRPSSAMYLVIRTKTDPASLAPAVRGVIGSIDKDQPVYRVTTMEKMMAGSLAQRRFAMLLLGIFAALAMVLAAVGLYGVMSYSVTQRTHEIGIRMALGAKQGDVLRMVIGQGAVLTSIGVGIGLVASFILTRWMAALLFGVSATDPVIFATIAVALSAVALVASYIPARRATKVDPMIALRYE